MRERIVDLVLVECFWFPEIYANSIRPLESPMLQTIKRTTPVEQNNENALPCAIGKVDFRK